MRRSPPLLGTALVGVVCAVAAGVTYAFVHDDGAGAGTPAAAQRERAPVAVTGVLRDGEDTPAARKLERLTFRPL